MRCGFLGSLGEHLEVALEVGADGRLVLLRNLLRLKVTEDALVDHRQLVDTVLGEGAAVHVQLIEDLPAADELVGRHALAERTRRLRTDDAAYRLVVHVSELLASRDDVRYPLPSSPVRGLLQSRVRALPGVRVLVKPDGVLLDEVRHASVNARAPGPQQPFLCSGDELHDVEPRHECGVQVCELVLVAFVDRSDDSASLRKGPSGETPVQGEVHDGLQYLRTCPVQLVEKKDDRLAVDREPVGRHEVGFPGLLVLAWKSYEVARVAHLAEEEGHHGHPFL